ncbi:MAG TPA: beta-ketoacyl synthase N-terminal-like domain-containing protein [Tepidisphaeraceae bacterium]|nr:beta-ketoacyl synthase N-terminal-like domain-containing protein [Tepidisphaeraceae bacterium]
MKSMPAITGIGLVSVLGQTAARTWDALLAGDSIADHARVAGFSGPDRAIPMAAQAASEALAHARWTSADCGRPDSGLFVGTSKGAIESWFHPPAPDVHPGLIGLAQIDHELSRILKFGIGPRLTLSSACSSGLHALLRAVMAIESGEAKRVLVVAVEASVHPLFISSFHRLGVLAPEGHGCRPFDRRRRGFLVAEAAAAVCLESSEDSPARPLARIDRWAVGSDGTHLTGGDPQAKTLRRLLAQVGGDPVGGDHLDLVHAHATGTIVNDPVELAAVQTIAGKSQPILYSHKGALGHSLGAAGLISVVLNCLCHSHGIVPGNVRSTDPLAADGLHFSRLPVRRPIHRSLAIAAGFGGPLAVVSIVGT